MTEEQFVSLMVLVFGLLIGFVANHIYHMPEIEESNEIINTFRESSIKFPDPPSRVLDIEYDQKVLDYFVEIARFRNELIAENEHTMNNDNYVILTNTRHTEPIMAAHDLNDKVSSLKQAVIRLIEIYEEAESGGDGKAMTRDHQSVISAARSLVADNMQKKTI